jgi:hypothetical protein
LTLRHRNGSERPSVPNYFLSCRANVTERFKGAAPRSR